MGTQDLDELLVYPRRLEVGIPRTTLVVALSVMLGLLGVLALVFAALAPKQDSYAVLYKAPPWEMRQLRPTSSSPSPTAPPSEPGQIGPFPSGLPQAIVYLRAR